MNSTPLWVPLAVAALGVASTVVGIIVTQFLANRRERESWKRETDRERERWAREDQAKTFDHRREAYITYYEVLRSAMVLVDNYMMSGSDGPPIVLPDSWNYPLFEQLQRVEMYGSPTVIALAQRTFELTTAWGGMSRPGKNDEGLNIQATGAQLSLLDAIRKDLGVPDDAEKRFDSST